MTVTSTSLSTGVTRALQDQSARLSAVLNSKPVAQTKNADASVAVDVADSAPVNEAVTLRVQSVTVSFSATKLDVLDTGATQVLRILGQLQSLASRASLAGLSDSERTVLSGQFQALANAINNVPPAPPGSEFTAEQLLGSLAGDVPAQDGGATVGGFSVSKLLGDANLSSEAAAEAAAQTIAVATVKVAAQRETVGRLQAVVEFAGAAIEGGLQNQEAQNATFDDVDVSLAAALSQSDKVANAQTNRLPADILKLLNQ